MSLQAFTKQVLSKEHLTREEMHEAANRIFSQIDDVETVKQFLIALHEKGETAEEIVGLVDVVMSKSQKLAVNGAEYFDNCGTGGDKLNTFNISTTTAFVLAGAGVKMAKHGNRKISSQSGSSDVLEALGISIERTPDATMQQLLAHDIAFLHAPIFHPVLGQLREIRSSIPHATIFNYIGPLCNPLDVEKQIVGVNRAELLETYAEALFLLGRKRAIVVSGEAGLDEASLVGTTHYALVDGDRITYHSLKAEDFELEAAPLSAIRGGNASENAEILVDVLRGEDNVYSKTVLLNGALGLFAHGSVSSLEEGYRMAKESIRSGRALAKLLDVQLYHQKASVAQ